MTDPGRHDPHHGAVLRSADPGLIDQVRRLCALGGLELTVVPPGSGAPVGSIHLDDVTVPVEPRWSEVVTTGRVVELAAAGHGGADALHLPADAESLLDLLSQAAAPVRAAVIGVIGASGGLGVSALAAVLARLVVGTGSATALVDLDPAGGGLDVLLGVEHDAGPRWADVLTQHGGFPPDRLTSSLPVWHSVRVLSGDVRGGVDGATPVALAAVTALARARDVVVLDLPRLLLAPGVDPGWLRLCGDVVLLAGCDVRSAAAATTAAATLAATGTPAGLVVRGPAPGSLQPADIAEACELPLITVMRAERAFAAGVERGMSPGDQPRGPLRAAGRSVLRHVGLLS
ncbi:septum site-determining protein Ssd [Georgenia sunbinii]|uniref:septum site-determining protein Ssd n=1 Tax=Georgenia sunbinii TaxID=3117728 RepID=UPI002F263848